MKNEKTNRERAHDLVNTSVQDMQSGLWDYGLEDAAVLREAVRIVSRRGEKTKEKILNAYIKRLMKAVKA